jgi:putative tricarboxylic transport membrane protein
MVHGILPGPNLLTDHGAITYTLIWAIILANIPLFFIGLAMTRVCIYVTRVPKMVVALAIVVLSVIGSLAINNNFFDVWLMLGFGALGYVFDRARIPTAPMVIGLVLGFLLDSSLAQALLIGYGEWTVFLKSPIAAGLLLVALLSILQATPFFRLFARKRRAATPEVRSAEQP